VGPIAALDPGRYLRPRLSPFFDLADDEDVFPPIEPSAEVRVRLLRSVSGAERFAPFVDRFAELFALTAEAARALFVRAEDPAEWSSPMPGLQCLRFESGLEGAECWLARFAAGLRYPRHRHLGRELAMVLEGGYTDSDGSLVIPGDVRLGEKGSSHGLSVHADGDCTAALAIWGGIEILGA